MFAFFICNMYSNMLSISYHLLIIIADLYWVLSKFHVLLYYLHGLLHLMLTSMSCAFYRLESEMQGSLSNLTKGTWLVDGRCRIWTQKSDAGTFAYSHKVVYLHLLYDKHMTTLRGSDGHPHFIDGQVESQRIEINYPDHTGSKRSMLASSDPNESS